MSNYNLGLSNYSNPRLGIVYSFNLIIGSPNFAIQISG